MAREQYVQEQILKSEHDARLKNDALQVRFEMSHELHIYNGTRTPYVSDDAQNKLRTTNDALEVRSLNGSRTPHINWGCPSSANDDVQNKLRNANVLQMQ